jgi:hypothetical protein
MKTVARRQLPVASAQSFGFLQIDASNPFRMRPTSPQLFNIPSVAADSK